MAMLKTRFSRKLHAAFVFMLLITLALAWYFYDSVKWYEHDVQRIALANNILQGYQRVSILTFRELGKLGDRVLDGEAIDASSQESSDKALRRAISQVRQAIAARLAFDQNISQSQDLEVLVDIERVMEEIIRSSGEINLALADGRPADAAGEFKRLSNAGIAGYFEQLISQAIEVQRREVLIADQDALSLSRYITKVLPVFMLVLVVLTLAIIFLFSRGLRRSVGALHDGVRAFSSGNLNHRIPSLREREFWRLGEAFNTMARQLSDIRTNLHDANVTLEATVEERTRALQASNKKLANVDINRRKLLADISHEFRTPLTVIRGEAEIALRGSTNSADDYRRSFQRIMDQADHTTHLVDDLLFIARVDAGEPRITLRSVAIGSLVSAVCNEFSAKAEQKQISIEKSCKDSQAVVLGDAGRLRQVFAILMDNALRYSNPGGRVEVGLTRTDSEVNIIFRDFGIGLSEEEAEQAFERFYRGEKAEEHARGTGLGLPVAKAIITAHQGRIRLEGELGKGAIATVTLPAESRLRVVA